MSLLNPRSVAVIGASADERKVGHMILKNLLTPFGGVYPERIRGAQGRQGFAGNVYPVNPKDGEILGKKTHRTIGEIEGTVDLAVIVTPAETVPSLLEECGKKKVPWVIVISAGFGEAGEEGRQREEELRTIAKRYDIRLVGPNCLGVMRPSLRMNASFGNVLSPAGNVALLSQSGALGEAFIDRAGSLGLGLSLFISMGNKAALDECDYLELCAEDPETKVIGLYLESITNGRRFLELARRIGVAKPIVLLKAGTTAKGGKAVSSHTGAMAGSDAAVTALCIQGGIRRAASAEHFLDLLRTLSTQPPLASPAIAVITNAGGPGVLAADACEREGLLLPALSPDHEAALKKALPTTASVGNPIDVLGDALADRFEAALRTAAQDPAVDGALVIVTPQVMTPTREIAEKVVLIRTSHPLFPIVTAFMGGAGVEDAVTFLQQHGVPNFTSPEVAVKMLAALQPHPRPSLSYLTPTPSPLRRRGVHSLQLRALTVRKTGKERVLGGEVGLLDEVLTTKLLSLYNLPLPLGRVAKTAEEAVTIAREIGFPVTAKISSKDILHKTDVGGVRINLMTEKDVTKAWKDILTNVKEKAPKAHVAGLLIQQSLPPGSEFIVGAVADPGVGHLVMAGLGGVYTELFKDASFRIAPVTAEEAYRMLAELRGWKILMGMRGKPQLNVDALAAMIAQVSLLVTECPAITEIDLNPVLVGEEELTILDAKVVVSATL